MKRRVNFLNWAGFGIVVLAFISYFFLFATFPMTRDLPWANYILFLIGGALITVGVRRAFADPLRYRGKISGSILATLSALLFGFFVLSVTYLSKQIPSATSAIGVSQKAPAFQLADTGGRQISSAALLQNHRGLVLIFYRGYW